MRLNKLLKKPRRVVITGMGICSPLGNTLPDVGDALITGKNGITADADFAARGFRSKISGRVSGLVMPEVEKNTTRAFGDGNLLKFAYYAMDQAVKDSGLTPEQVSSAGIIMGNGGPSTRDQVNAANKAIEKGKPFSSPLIVIPTMTSGPAALLATAFKLKAFNYMVGAACATSTLAIGEAAEKIMLGYCDVAFAGGAESADWELALGFDAGAMSHNDDPQTASCPFDAKRDGFVLSEGAGVVTLEEYEHARRRNARIYGEITGYGQSSDGHHLTDPSQEGAERAIRAALEDIDPDSIDYVNMHGTSTGKGDANELNALANIFTGKVPYFSSTKSAAGHSLGATGAHELIYTLLAMWDNFLPANLNLTKPDPLLSELKLLERLVVPTPHGTAPQGHIIRRAMSNNFGFGGVNVVLVVDNLNAIPA